MDDSKVAKGSVKPRARAKLPSSLLREEGDDGKSKLSLAVTLKADTEKEMIKALQALPAVIIQATVYLSGREAPVNFMRHLNKDKGTKTESLGGWLQEGVTIGGHKVNTYIAPTAVIMGSRTYIIDSKVMDNAVVDSCGLWRSEVDKNAYLVGPGQGSTLFNEKIAEGKKQYLRADKGIVPKAGDIIMGGVKQNNLVIPNENSVEINEMDKKFLQNPAVYTKLAERLEDLMFQTAKTPLDFRVKSSDPEVAKVKAIMALIFSSTKYNLDWSKDIMKASGQRDVSLERAIEKGEGVCFEEATIAAILLKKEGIDAYLVNGRMSDMYKGFSKLIHGFGNKMQITNHAWVRAYINGVEYVVDPTNMIFAEASVARKLFMYHEDEVSYLSDDSPVDTTGAQKAKATVKIRK